MYKLRQKSWGVFIRPYITVGGDRLIQRGNLSVKNPCTTSSSDYLTVKDGQAWMLYKGSFVTSYTLALERAQEVQDTLGYPEDDIMIMQLAHTGSVMAPRA